MLEAIAVVGALMMCFSYRFSTCEPWQPSIKANHLAKRRTFQALRRKVLERCWVCFEWQTKNLGIGIAFFEWYPPWQTILT
jgi:hypothetical protein